VYSGHVKGAHERAIFGHFREVGGSEGGVGKIIRNRRKRGAISKSKFEETACGKKLLTEEGGVGSTIISEEKKERNCLRMRGWAAT